MSYCMTRRPVSSPVSTATFPSMATLVNDLLSDPFFTGARAAGSAAASAGTLAVDVSEDDGALIVRASLPGFQKEEIDIQVHEGVLTIKGERAAVTEEKTERYHRRERRTGSVARMISLPETVNGEDVKAELKDGVLTLRLAKTPKEQPRKVQIG